MGTDDISFKVTFTQIEYNRLLLMMGYAVASAMEKDRKMAYNFLDLVNRINKNNPHWTPYEIPEEFQMITEP